MSNGQGIYNGYIAKTKEAYILASSEHYIRFAWETMNFIPGMLYRGRLLPAVPSLNQPDFTVLELDITKIETLIAAYQNLLLAWKTAGETVDVSIKESKDVWSGAAADEARSSLRRTVKQTDQRQSIYEVADHNFSAALNASQQLMAFVSDQAMTIAVTKKPVAIDNILGMLCDGVLAVGKQGLTAVGDIASTVVSGGTGLGAKTAGKAAGSALKAGAKAVKAEKGSKLAFLVNPASVLLDTLVDATLGIARGCNAAKSEGAKALHDMQASHSIAREAVEAIKKLIDDAGNELNRIWEITVQCLVRGEKVPANLGHQLKPVKLRSLRDEKPKAQQPPVLKKQESQSKHRKQSTMCTALPDEHSSEKKGSQESGLQTEKRYNHKESMGDHSSTGNAKRQSYSAKGNAHVEVQAGEVGAHHSQAGMKKVEHDYRTSSNDHHYEYGSGHTTQPVQQEMTFPNHQNVYGYSDDGRHANTQTGVEQQDQYSQSGNQQVDAYHTAKQPAGNYLQTGLQRAQMVHSQLWQAFLGEHPGMSGVGAGAQFGVGTSYAQPTPQGFYGDLASPPPIPYGHQTMPGSPYDFSYAYSGSHEHSFDAGMSGAYEHNMGTDGEGRSDNETPDQPDSQEHHDTKPSWTLRIESEVSIDISSDGHADITVGSGDDEHVTTEHSDNAQLHQGGNNASDNHTSDSEGDSSCHDEAHTSDTKGAESKGNGASQHPAKDLNSEATTQGNDNSSVEEKVPSPDADEDSPGVKAKLSRTATAAVETTSAEAVAAPQSVSPESMFTHSDVSHAGRW